jgi:hypothetical protein
LFKPWSNLGFDQDLNGHKNSGKNEKTKAHSLLTSYIYSKHIQVDKQGLDI